MWTKKMIRRFPKRWREWHKAHSGKPSPVSEKLTAKRLKALCDMGYVLVDGLLVRQSPHWVVRVWDPCRLEAWVVKKSMTPRKG